MHSYGICHACKLFGLFFCSFINEKQINGALPQAYPNNLNRASDYACIVFIFVFTFGYSIGFGPAAWVYGAEVYLTTDHIYGNTMLTLSDFPHWFPSSRLELCSIWGSYWFHHRCTSMASRHPERGIENLFLLHGD